MKRLLLAVIILGGLSLSASAQAGKNKQSGQAKDTRSARTAPQKTTSNGIVIVNGQKVKPSSERLLSEDMLAEKAAKAKQQQATQQPQPAQKKKLPNLQGNL